MSKFNNYLVVLHDHQKHNKSVTIRTCVSGSGAMKVANYLEKIKVFHSNYRATNVYKLDEKGSPIW